MPVDKFMAKRIAEMKRAQQQAAQAGKAKASGTNGQILTIPEAPTRIEPQTPQVVTSPESTITHDTPSGTNGSSIQRPLWQALGLQNPNIPKRTLGQALGVTTGSTTTGDGSTVTMEMSEGLNLEENQPITIGAPTITTGPRGVNGTVLALPPGFGTALPGEAIAGRPGFTDPSKVPLSAEERLAAAYQARTQGIIPSPDLGAFETIDLTTTSKNNYDQKHSYRDIRDGYNLLGGHNSYTYPGNDRDRGTFVDYPGASKRYNTNPTTNSTMARLAIPIPGNVKEFIHRSGFGHHMSRLAKAILTNGVTGLGYIDFLLQNIQEGFSEKVQISETVGDNYVAFFFGMAPPVFTFSGQLLNTFQDEWRTSMHMLYQNLLRGTKLARNKQLVSIYYDQMIANGYMLNHNQNFTAEMQMASSFSFQLLIKSITFFRLPRTRPTMPDKLPENIAFQNVYGLQRSAIKRTTRTVGVVKAEAAPSKGTLAPPAEPLSPTEAHKKLELYREAKPSQLTPSL